LLIAVEIEAIQQGNNETGTSEDGQALIDNGGDVVDVSLNVKSW
jgi:hypothetical protein